MLRGYFDRLTGLPSLPGRLIVPGMNFFGDLRFLVDTGAETSLLAPGDGENFFGDYSRLGRRGMSQGTAGTIDTFVERAHFAFTHVDGMSKFVYEVDIRILSPTPGLAGLPSLIGRDILDRWRMVYDPVNSELTFDVHSADDSLPVSR